MQTIQSILNKCSLSQSSAIKAYDLAKKLQRFIKYSQKESQLFTSQKTCDQKSFVNMSIKLLEKLCHNSVEKSWLRLLFVDSLINYCSVTLIGDEFINFLDVICEQARQKINRNPLRRTQKSKTFMGKVTTGLSKISSMINVGYFSQSIQLHKKGITMQQNPLKSLPIEIPTKIVLQYGVYLRKKLQNYKFYIRTRQKYELKDKIIIKSDKHFSDLREYVWKIINLISHHTIIVKSYKKIAFIQSDSKPSIVSTFTMLCRDCLIFYPYIVKLIELQSQEVKQKYSKIIGEKRQQKDIKKVKLQAFSKQIMFVQIENLLKQLTPINQTIFYLFCGKLHYEYINLQVPKHYFLNTANPKLDEIHNILREVKLVVEKQQKSKLYRTQLSIKLDNSVNKIVERLDSSRSFATMKDIRSFESKDTQESNEVEENQKAIHYQMKKEKRQKTYSFFQEITQII